MVMKVRPPCLWFSEKIIVTSMLNFKESINNFLSKTILNEAPV